MAEQRDVFELDRVIHQIGGPVAGAGSCAMLSRDRDTVVGAIVLVHGFGGSPVSSWSGFAEAFGSDSRLAAYDGYFFGYKSQTRQVGSLANSLAHFLRLLVDGELHELILKELGHATPAPSEYRPVVLAAHSMGGVIAREALLLLAKEGREQDRRFCLRLFAPAHAGARIQAAALGLATSFPPLEGLISMLSFLLPAANDLDPARSRYLSGLRSRTEHLARAGLTHLGADCVFGDAERVVVVDQFDCDARQMPDPSPHDHFSLVRLTSAWQWPVQFVAPEAGSENAGTPESGMMGKS